MTAILERCPRCHLLRRAVPEDACCAMCGTVDDLVPSKHDDEILCEACEHTLDTLHQCPRCLCCHQSPAHGAGPNGRHHSSFLLHKATHDPW